VTTWSGRVEGSLDREVWAFLRSDDAELLPYDCEATAEHARRLAAAGILTEEELDDAESKLAEIAQDPDGYLDSDEDVHSAIERLLGDVGRKIHAGRSRNDQVAAAFRMYVLDACAEAREAIDALALVVLSFAESETETVMPGYTHLQRAQPITLGHHLLAWVEMLDRDRTRFAAAAEAAAESPLGAGALAGSTLELPPPPRQMRNSLDAVADRDFAVDYLYAAAVLFTHLSRIGEEIVLWATSEFGFVRLPESAATGSSMMPQKLNPDVAELSRGKAGTAIGRLAGLLATVKGLPLAYDRDLQEDKPPVFATRRDVRLALGARAGEFDPEDALAVALDGANGFRGRGGEIGRVDGHVDRPAGRDADAQPVRDRGRAGARKDRLQGHEQHVEDDEGAEDPRMTLRVDLCPEEGSEHQREQKHERRGSDKEQAHDTRVVLAPAKHERCRLDDRDEPASDGAERLSQHVASISPDRDSRERRPRERERADGRGEAGGAPLVAQDRRREREQPVAREERDRRENPALGRAEVAHEEDPDRESSGSGQEAGDGKQNQPFAGARRRSPHGRPRPLRRILVLRGRVRGHGDHPFRSTQGCRAGRTEASLRSLTRCCG